MEVPREILNDIADSIEAGYKCFIHRETFEVVKYPDDLDGFADFSDDDDAWKEEKKKIKKHKKKFVEIEDMDSRHKFRVMEAFAASLEDNPTKIRLITALE